MLKKNEYMKMLLHTYDPMGWKRLVDRCRSCSASYPGIPGEYAVVSMQDWYSSNCNVKG